MKTIENGEKVFDLMDGNARDIVVGNPYYDEGCDGYRVRVIDQEGCLYDPLISNLVIANETQWNTMD